VPLPMSIEDHTVVGLYVVETLLVLATYSGKPNILSIPLCETTTVH
jgi:putative methionine-R-sulfoxide reductase with GAF domain